MIRFNCPACSQSVGLSLSPTNQPIGHGRCPWTCSASKARETLWCRLAQSL